MKIPGGWKEVKLGEMCDVLSSIPLSRAELSDAGYCYLHYGDIHKMSRFSVDVNSYLDRKKANVEDPKDDVLLLDGDLVFVDASEDYEGVSKYVVIKNTKNIPFISGLHTIHLRSKNAEIDNGYKEFVFQNAAVKQQMKTKSTGMKVFGLNKTEIQKIIFPLPPLPEQKAIADLLSTWDTAIEKTERLIELKGKQKKWLMQNFLTGKKRLPGFSGKWKTVKLGEICEKIKSGGTPLSTIKEYYNGDIPFLSIGDMTLQGKYLKYTTNKVSQKGIENSSSWIVPKGSLIYSMYASIGFVSISLIELAISQAVLCISFKKNYLTEFMYYLLSNMKNSVMKYVGEGTQKNLNAKVIRNFEIRSPPLPEQQAIADVLTIADQEIEQLKSLVKKYKSQKRGLMQKLLTGKWRVKGNNNA